MTEDLSLVIEETAIQMTKALDHLESELVKIRAGKATPNMLDGIMADYYGNPTAINQVANVTAMDARTLSVQPWEKNMLAVIERAIIAANIGINPQNDGNIIRLFLPPLTEERRKELVKRCNAEGEHAKLFTVQAIVDGEIITQALDYNKKNAEKLAAEKTCAILSI